ncbi:acyl carrier protein [Streptomyces cinereoruber]|uniref:acyl carrier protein n=2 Tax=Streptomyces cinereoruber TaxID=67260 RepID=UPI00345CE239
MQELLVDWVSEFLETDVSLEDNFLDLGGHSLLAMNLNVRVQQRFGHELDVKTLFERPLGDAVGELHERVAAQQAAWPVRHIVPTRSWSKGCPVTPDTACQCPVRPAWPGFR